MREKVAAMADQTVTLNVEGFPYDLRLRVKLLAAERGMHLKGAVIQALQNWCVDQEEYARQVRAYRLNPNVKVPPQRDRRPQ
jgi:hypothetical protein